MYDIYCECKQKLVFDYKKSFGHFLSCQTDTKCSNKWLSNHLVYHCSKCKKEFAYTFLEVEEKVRSSIQKDIMQFKKINMLKKINPITIDPDNGIIYCGLCDGVDGEGNCYNDLYKQCTIK